MTRIGDLEVFPLVLGGNVFGWTADRERSFEILDAFVAGGGTLIDTAEGYSSWAPGNDGLESERVIGVWLADRQPAGVQIATKTGGHREYRNLDPERVRAAIDGSLERLGVESIDLYWLHYDDEEVPIGTQVETFAEFVADGRAKQLGLSNFTVPRIRAWLEEASRQGAPLPVALQPHYNLVERGIELDVVPLAQEYGLALLPYWGLAAGFLAGKYRAPVEGGDSPRAAQASKYATPKGLAVLDALDRIAEAHEVAVASVALAWLRQQPTVAAPIASASKPEQVPDLLASATIALTPAELAELDRVSAP